MKKYIGVKLIEAETMMLNEAEEVLQRKIQSQNEPGYLVKYPDGYQSWSPKKVFEEAYRETSGMTFGLAIEATKKGHKISRAGWNGKGMFLYYVPANEYYAITKAAKEIAGENGKVQYGAYIAMKTAQGNVVPWLASQTDVLADDWQIVE